MKKIFYLLMSLLFIQSICAGTIKFRSPLEEKIYHYSVQLAYHKANTDPKAADLKSLLAFVHFMRPDLGVAKNIKTNLIYGKPQSVKGRDTSQFLGKNLSDRAVELEGDKDKREFLYIYAQMAEKYTKLNESTHLIMDDARASAFNLNLAHLFKIAGSPEIYDVEVEAAQLAAEAERQRKEDEEMRRISGSDDEGGGIEEDDFKSLLQNHKMTVAYSEVSAISMLNEMIHAMYWLGVTFEYEGIRLSHLGPMKATNGAVFYKSVLPRPEKETYTLANKSVRDILEHMCESLNLEYKVEGNSVKITDAPPPLFPEWGTAGVPAYVLQQKLRNYSRTQIEKYKGKEFKVNGYIQNMGTGSSRNYMLTLDSDQIIMQIPLYNVDLANWSDLNDKMKTWRTESKKSKKDSMSKNRRDRPQGEFERIEYGSKNVYVTAYVTAEGIKGGKLYLSNAKKVSVKGLGRRITLDEDND
ncbi:hypothetical protein LNTAR_00075 [Lentisphaera araneosa HTCC2155]|uniref:Uncharacterized protein n=1 Tax=Lentisphaera araneosa HTCC2155 TaxID=313628 RepID=A6DK52_9BACT|nr:hypothetical protein [Lentisphaera araneosa]EDM27750.1 hypothetical protein LNTAR_00075 [Lentisphaera araneosa HTCC2155]